MRHFLILFLTLIQISFVKSDHGGDHVADIWRMESISGGNWCKTNSAIPENALFELNINSETVTVSYQNQTVTSQRAGRSFIFILKSKCLDNSPVSGVCAATIHFDKIRAGGCIYSGCPEGDQSCPFTASLVEPAASTGHQLIISALLITHLLIAHFLIAPLLIHLLYM